MKKNSTLEKLVYRNVGSTLFGVDLGSSSKCGQLLPVLRVFLWKMFIEITRFRRSHPDVFLRKGFLKTCSKITREHPCRGVISIKLLCNFIEIALRHWCSPVNLLHIFRTPFPKNTSGWLLLKINFIMRS